MRSKMDAAKSAAPFNLNVRQIQMKALKNVSLIYLLTPILGAIAYVTAVVIFEGGKELGEPMWRGYITQVFLLSSYGLIIGIILLLPFLFLVEQKIKDEKNIILFYAILLLLFLTITYTLYAGASPLSSLIVSIVPASVITFIKYQLLCCRKNA